jgi:uncharacterized protein YndB with AHSA1/START domain
MVNTIAATDRKTRTFQMEIDIDASPEKIWHALTDAGELVRWFPLDARVTPGVDGSMFWSWGENWAGEARIDAWEPSRRLVLTEHRQAFDAAGKPLPGEQQPMAMEFTLETNAGRTRLRLVHSGFGVGDNWDDELDSTSAGWQHELRSLRHYVQRHRGNDRHAAFVHRTTPLSARDVWRRLLGPQGFVVSTGALVEGQHCELRSADGERFAGLTQLHAPEWDAAIVVDDLDEGLLRLSTWRAAGQTGVQIWLCTWNRAHADRVREFQPRAVSMLNRLLA